METIAQREEVTMSNEETTNDEVTISTDEQSDFVITEYDAVDAPGFYLGL